MSHALATLNHSNTIQSPRRTTNAKAHRIFAAIVTELELVDAELALPEERFEFWAKRLWTKYPRNDHLPLYNQLGAMAFRLSQYRWKASLQLFALATMSLDAEQAKQRSNGDNFLAREGEEARRLARDMASTAVMPAVVLKPSNSNVAAVGLPPPSGDTAIIRNRFAKRRASAWRRRS